MNQVDFYQGLIIAGMPIAIESKNMKVSALTRHHPLRLK
jgi:hypothetical protein